MQFFVNDNYADRACWRMRRPIVGLLWVSLSVLSLGARSAHSHALEESYVFLTMGDSIEARVELGVVELNQALDLGLAEDGSVTEADLASVAPAIIEYVVAGIRVAPDGQDAKLTPHDVLLRNTSFTQFILVNLSAPRPSPPEFIDVGYDLIFDAVPDHRTLLVVENNWLSSTFENEADWSLLFDESTRQARLDLSSSSLLLGLAGMVELGMEHIWTGIDHVLFLIALLLPSVMYRRDKGWQPLPGLKTAFFNVVKIVTSFTVAHTVTLSMATLDIVTVDSRLVESIIALSIAVVAIEIVKPMFGNWTYAAVFAFGLFHGFGFASILRDMPIPSDYVAWSLLGFNVGVEIGQLVIVAIAVPILFLLRNWSMYPRFTMPAGACALIVIASYWFIERAFEVDLPAGAIVNTLFGWA